MDNLYLQRRSTNDRLMAHGQSCPRVMSGPGGLTAHGQQAARASSHLLVAAALGYTRRTLLATLLPRFATSLSLRTLLMMVRSHNMVIGDGLESETLRQRLWFHRRSPHRVRATDTERTKVLPCPGTGRPRAHGHRIMDAASLDH
jgi:hypothetical protein